MCSCNQTHGCATDIDVKFEIIKYMHMSFTRCMSHRLILSYFFSFCLVGNITLGMGCIQSFEFWTAYDWWGSGGVICLGTLAPCCAVLLSQVLLLFVIFFLDLKFLF